MEIQALVRDKASENWGRLLELTDADGQVHRWAMPMEMLKGSGEELRGELLRLGLQIAPGMKARQGFDGIYHHDPTRTRAPVA